MTVDPRSAAAHPPKPERHVQLAVVGAGPAGVAAALAARAAELDVLLVDENPIDPALMGMDVPLWFGGRFDGSVRNAGRMTELMLESAPALAEAYEAGVDVALGTCVWGAFRNGPACRLFETPMLGLADAQRSWLVGFDRLIVAAGARDLALSFAGWEKPGVMGAVAAHALLRRYRAFSGRRILVLGAGALGLGIAALALEQGIGVAGIVDVGPAQGPDALRAELIDHGVRFFTRHAVREAVGTGEIAGAVLVRLDDELRPISGGETRVECDTVVVAIGRVPNVEIPCLLDCALGFDGARGGHVPVLDEWQRASVPEVFVAGDAACISDSVDESLASARGRIAGLGAALSLGAVDPKRARALRPALPAAGAGRDLCADARAWLRALVNAGGDGVTVCQCEEVTRRELVGVQPPRYLNSDSARMRARDLPRLIADGPVNQDQVKRLTRAGMGHCQGRRCREQIAMLLAEASGTAPERIALASYRPPLRPLPMSVLSPADEPGSLREMWDVWFGIPTQFLPHWDADTAARSRAAGTSGASGK